MSTQNPFFYDCDEFLKYLNTSTNVDIENATVLEKDKYSVSKPAIDKWKTLANRPEKARIEKLNRAEKARIEKLTENNVANIAIFENIERLRTKITHDNTTPNAKRVFNMLVSDHEKLKFCITDDNKDTSLVKYMTGVLKVKNDVNYLPGRSVNLSMLCDFGKTLNTNYKKSGIVEGLKALVGLKLVEAFLVTETDDGKYAIKQVSKSDISEDKEILYRLSIKGCAEYLEVDNRNCANR